jgi:hypothetical protein
MTEQSGSRPPQAIKEVKAAPSEKIVPDWAIEILGGRKLVKTVTKDKIEKSYVIGGGGVMEEELMSSDSEGFYWILRHNLLVFRAADWLASHLESKGIGVDRQAVRLGALLHDTSGRRRFEEVMRNEGWKKGRPEAAKKIQSRGHGWLGSRIIRAWIHQGKIPERDRDLAERVAQIVWTHDRVISDPLEPKTIEEKIVLWADHIGAQSKVKEGLMSLKERLTGIRKRWVATGRMSQDEFDGYKNQVERIQFELFGEMLGGEVKPGEVPALPTRNEKKLVRQIETFYERPIPGLDPRYRESI